MFTIKSNKFSPVDIILMANTINVLSPTNPKMTFDLKGSRINRMENFEKDQYWWRENFGHKRVMKDLNLLQINSDYSNTLINFPKDQV